MKPISVHLIIAIFCIAAISACTIAPVPFFQPPTETPTPTPFPSPTSTPLPHFKGTLLLRIRRAYDGDVYELTYDANTWTTTSTPVIEGAGRAMLSPDGSHLFVYQREASEVIVIDVLSGEETTFELPEDLGDMTSVSVSPDSTGICYATSTGKIYLYNISLGKSWLLFTAPSANYSFSGGTKTFVHGDAGCGLWLGADHFVIYRYVGSMPSKVTSPTYEEIAINTTTIVTIGDKPKFEDTKQWLFVEAVSSDGLSIVYTDKKDNSIYLARNFRNFKELDSQLLIQLDLLQVAFFEFLPDNRLLYAMSFDSGSGVLYPDYSIVNLADLEFREWKLPEDCGYGFVRGGGWDNGYHRTWQWIGEPGSGMIACVADVVTSDLDQVFEVFVANVATGSATSIFKLESGNLQWKRGEIIGWLP